MKRRIAIVATMCIITACIVGPISYSEGRGPAVSITKVEALGPAIPGGRLGVRVWGRIRPGCVPFVARSFERWEPVGQKYRVVSKQPLTNIPTVSSPPPIPASLSDREEAPFVDVYFPLPDKLTPGPDWYLMGEASGMFCEPWWKRVFGMSRSQTFYSLISIQETPA